MVNDLKLSGNNLLVYALVYGFSQDGESKFTGSLAYICETLNISKPTAIKALDFLYESGFIGKNEINCFGAKHCEYYAILTGSKESLPGSKESLPGGKESLPGVVKKLYRGGKESLPNNILYNINNNIDNNIYTQNPEKIKFGELKNVELTKEQFEKLETEYGADAQKIVDNFADIVAAKGYKYKNYYLAVKNWGARAFYEKMQKQPGAKHCDTKTINDAAETFSNMWK